jgi:hypothetical protein
MCVCVCVYVCVLRVCVCVTHNTHLLKNVESISRGELAGLHNLAALDGSVVVKLEEEKVACARELLCRDVRVERL